MSTIPPHSSTQPPSIPPPPPPSSSLYSAPPPVPQAQGGSMNPYGYPVNQAAGGNDVNAAAYAAYYNHALQMQYMYSGMYGTPTAYMQAYAAAANSSGSVATSATQAAQAMQHYNYNKPSTTTISTENIKPEIKNPVAQTINSEAKDASKPNNAIKINLKFQQHTLKSLDENKTDDAASTTPRKSRFNTFDSISNVKAQQASFSAAKSSQIANEKKSNNIDIDDLNLKAKSPEKEVETKKAETASPSQPQSDIVFDINKWPSSLKAYCAKVYSHYQQITLVSEDQVTKYLQQRITEAFKLKPDLNIGWENEPMPNLLEIKRVAPYSNLKQQQIKKQQLNQQFQQQQQAKQAANLNKTPANQFKQIEPTKKTLVSRTINTSISDLNKESPAKKRKVKAVKSSRSSSSSSTSSSSSSSSSTSSSSSSKHSKNNIDEEDFIPLNNKNKNKFKGQGKFNKLNNKRNQQEINQQEKMEVSMGNVLNNKKFNNQKNKKLKKFNNNNRNFIIESTITARKSLRSIFDLAMEQENESIKENLERTRVCVGTSQDLEKEYLRLTGPPEAHMIRPLHILKKSFQFVLNKYNRTQEYRYICDQLKAIRQDLTVQVIKNDFTIEVYETHARIAIKNKDRDEFNQCQSQLKSLYNMALSESSANNFQNSKTNSAEFLGYRLLYNMLTKSFKDINEVIKEIITKYSNDSYLKHLLALKNAWYLNNYVKFFQLYKLSNEMCKLLIDLFIERERKLALKSIIKSFRPNIKLEIVKEMLAYESLQQCETDLLAYKLIIQKESSNSNDEYLVLDCKSCNIQSF